MTTPSHSALPPAKTIDQNALAISSLGLGGAPYSGLYHPVPEATAVETIRYAIEHGVTLLDTAPLYGLGLSEERLGKALAGVPRDQFTISTKIGRVLLDDRSDYVYDYSYDGVMRSLEGSLARLGLDAVEIVHIHEADPNDSQRVALETAFPTLADLREQGVIKAIGAGMNAWEALEHFVHNYEFDVFLLAGRYTLLEQGARGFLDLCHAKGIGILLAGVYNSGILATGPQAEAKYNYANAPRAILEKAQAIQAVCTRHDVPLNVAAVQFAQAHPAVTSLVIGAETAGEVAGNIAAMNASIPVALWAELRDEGLIEPAAPVPSGGG